MSNQTDGKSAPNVPKRLQPLLDCISHLLAKRWLRDQKRTPHQPPQGGLPPRDKSALS